MYTKYLQYMFWVARVAEHIILYFISTSSMPTGLSFPKNYNAPCLNRLFYNWRQSNFFMQCYNNLMVEHRNIFCHLCTVYMYLIWFVPRNSSPAIHLSHKCIAKSNIKESLPNCAVILIGIKTSQFSRNCLKSRNRYMSSKYHPNNFCLELCQHMILNFTPPAKLNF